jgi:ribose transport system ATP-binding protein
MPFAARTVPARVPFMNIIAGNLAPDTGTLSYNGEELQLVNRQQAQALGIGIVYQERSLVDSLSIAENIFPGNQPLNRWGFIDYARLNQQTDDLLHRLQMNRLSPKAMVGNLSPAQKSMVEIAKALAQQPSLLILDEPTASLTHQETETLFRIIGT